jgi:hypothetical protein
MISSSRPRTRAPRSSLDRDLTQVNGGPMLREFKKFLMRGNVVDLAVGLIMALAFSKIVTSFVNDVVMPR